MTVIHELRMLHLEKEDVMNMLHASARNNYQLQHDIQPLVDDVQSVEGRIQSLFDEIMDLVYQIAETECDISN